MWRIARSTPASARYWQRNPSIAVEARSVSPRTVLAREKAMAESAAESQRTARRAPPRAGVRRLEIAIIKNRVTVHVDRCRNADGFEVRGNRIKRRHGNTDAERPLGGYRDGTPIRQFRSRRLFEIGTTAEGQTVGE